MELITKAPKGTVDIVPGKSEKWQVVEDVFRSEAELNGFGEVRTPVFEHTELFQRGVGDTTDVVEKQMYTFEDKGGRSITLRPEGTAGAVRAMLENGLYNAGYPVKLYYLTSCYRYEKPQAGRLRELHQFGVEMFGAAEPVADAQIIAMALSAFKRLGLEDVGLQLNSIGCPECRKEYHKALKEYFTARKEQLCDTCLSRLERNPMRILDCKSPECQEVCKGAPKITDYLCEDCKAHFAKVQEFLTALGIEFEIDPGLVRGLDYYTRTVFEFPSKSLGFALGGGGRSLGQDHLGKGLGGVTDHMNIHAVQTHAHGAAQTGGAEGQLVKKAGFDLLVIALDGCQLCLLGGREGRAVQPCMISIKIGHIVGPPINKIRWDMLLWTLYHRQA